VLVGGSVYCWGINKKAQLGTGRSGPPSLVPIRVAGVTDAVAISAGVGHACVLLAGGGAECWGYDDYGQLGNGPATKLLHTASPVVFGG